MILVSLVGHEWIKTGFDLKLYQRFEAVLFKKCFCCCMTGIVVELVICQRELFLCHAFLSLVMAPYGKCEHATERTSSVWVERANILARPSSLCYCFAPSHFWSPPRARRHVLTDKETDSAADDDDVTYNASAAALSFGLSVLWRRVASNSSGNSLVTVVFSAFYCFVFNLF